MPAQSDAVDAFAQRTDSGSYTHMCMTEIQTCSNPAGAYLVAGKRHVAVIVEGVSADIEACGRGGRGAVPARLRAVVLEKLCEEGAAGVTVAALWVKETKSATHAHPFKAYNIPGPFARMSG